MASHNVPVLVLSAGLDRKSSLERRFFYPQDACLARQSLFIGCWASTTASAITPRYPIVLDNVFSDLISAGLFVAGGGECDAV